MQGKIAIGFLVCIVAGAAVASVAFGSAGSGRTITATALGTGIALVDADRSGKPSLGDYEVGLSRYVDPKTGKGMGHGSVVCTQTNAAGTEYQCQGVTHFAGGDVSVAGMFSPLAKSFKLAIVGGTGAYAGAKGTLTVRWLARDFSKARDVFEFQG
jgi:hypothetical protein